MSSLNFLFRFVECSANYKHYFVLSKEEAEELLK